MVDGLSRSQVIDACCSVAEARGFAIFVGNGYNARCAAAGRDCSRRFFMVGSMGLCSVLAAGFSRCARMGVIAIEGDGNALMGLSGYPLAASTARPPFLHVVLDNGTYETTGRQLTISPSVDFPAIAEGAGYDKAVSVSEPGEIRESVQLALDEELRIFLHARTRPHGSESVWPRVPFHPREIARSFMRSLEDGDGRETGR